MKIFRDRKAHDPPQPLGHQGIAVKIKEQLSKEEIKQIEEEIKDVEEKAIAHIEELNICLLYTSNEIKEDLENYAVIIREKNEEMAKEALRVLALSLIHIWKDGIKQNKKQDINEIVKRDQKLLVQVKKDSNDKKGARISTHINLPSKYIVLMPNTNIIKLYFEIYFLCLYIALS